MAPALTIGQWLFLWHTQSAKSRQPQSAWCHGVPSSPMEGLHSGRRKGEKKENQAADHEEDSDSAEWVVHSFFHPSHKHLLSQGRQVTITQSQVLPRQSYSYLFTGQTGINQTSTQTNTRVQMTSAWRGEHSTLCNRGQTGLSGLVGERRKAALSKQQVSWDLKEKQSSLVRRRGEHSQQREQCVPRCWAREAGVQWALNPRQGAKLDAPATSPQFARELSGRSSSAWSKTKKWQNSVKNKVCLWDITHHQLKTGSCQRELATVSAVSAVRKHCSLPLTHHTFTLPRELCISILGELKGWTNRWCLLIKLFR